MAHPDLDRLVDYCLRLAQDLLKKSGKFYPFAATMKPDGEIGLLALHSSEEKPLSQTLIDQLTELLKTLAHKEEARAAALCFDSRVSTDGNAAHKRDAIAVALEHSNGESVTVFLPYKKKFFGGRKYDPMIAAARERQFFP